MLPLTSGSQYTGSGLSSSWTRQLRPRDQPLAASTTEALQCDRDNRTTIYTGNISWHLSLAGSWSAEGSEMSPHARGRWRVMIQSSRVQSGPVQPSPIQLELRGYSWGVCDTVNLAEGKFSSKPPGSASSWVHLRSRTGNGQLLPDETDGGSRSVRAIARDFGRLQRPASGLRNLLQRRTC